MKTGMDSHGLHFVPRATLQDYKDRLYHGKPELNYKGIPYRQPKRIERMHAGDRLAVMGRQPVQDYELKGLAQEFFDRTGLIPTHCYYSGSDTRRWRGVNLEGAGQVLLELAPFDGDIVTYVTRVDPK